MNVSHVTGGGIGAIAGALLVGLLKKYAGLDITDVDAAAIGSAALSAGVGIGHAINVFGVKGLAKIFWRGAPAK